MNNSATRWRIGGDCLDKRFHSKEGNGRLGKRGRCDVSRLVQRARTEEGGPLQVWYALVGFDGQVVIPDGQISLLMNMEGKEVTVAFIVVALFSPYMAILGRPWIHTMGAVPSTLHVKIKFRTKQGIVVVRGSQQVARQCLVATVDWKHKQAKPKGIVEEASL